MSMQFIDPKDAVVEQPLLILTPWRMLFFRLGRVLAFLFIAAFFSFNIFWYISIPLYLIAAYLLYELASIWRAHHYSTLVLYLLTFAIFLVFFGTSSLLRSGLYYLIQALL